MRPKSLVLLLLALGCGLVASIGINQVMAKRANQSSGPVEMQAIYVALKDLPGREPLLPEAIKLEEWPKDKIPPGAVTKPEELAGSKTRSKIYQGEPILKSKIYGEGESLGSPTDYIPAGYRVVPVKVDDVSGGAKLIQPDDRVDVQVYVRRNPASGIPQTGTITVLQNVKVFAVNDVFDRELTGDTESNIAAKTISLLVQPDDARKLTLASELGSIRLTLRGPDDQAEDASGMVSIQDLLQPGVGTATPPDGQTGEGLLGFLNGLSPAAPPESEKAASGWTMLLLNGKDARQFEFQDGERLPQQRSVSQPPMQLGPAPVGDSLDGVLPPEGEEAEVDDATPEPIEIDS